MGGLSGLCQIEGGWIKKQNHVICSFRGKNEELKTVPMATDLVRDEGDW
jgi:hypothetical protein